MGKDNWYNFENKAIHDCPGPPPPGPFFLRQAVAGLLRSYALYGPDGQRPIDQLTLNTRQIGFSPTRVWKLQDDYYCLPGKPFPPSAARPDSRASLLSVACFGYDLVSRLQFTAFKMQLSLGSADSTESIREALSIVCLYRRFYPSFFDFLYVSLCYVIFKNHHKKILT